LPGIGLHGTSGHSVPRQFLFAFGSYGPFTAGIMSFFAKDMYILKFGANPLRVGALTMACSALTPLMYPLAGTVMDRGLGIFQWRGWGRRAPWYVVHLPPLSLAVGLVYVPGLVWELPDGSIWLEVWLAGCLLTIGWCMSVLINALESARAEIYPFSDERVRVEAWTKVIGILATGTAVIPQLILWAIFTLPLRLGFSIFFAACVSLSMVATSTLCDAQQPCTGERASLKEAWEVLCKPPMMHATAARFWNSAADTTIKNFTIYYLTLIDGLASTDRATSLALAGAVVGVVEILLIPFWAWLWSGKSNHLLGRRVPSMQTACILFHVLAAVIPPLMLRLLPLLGTPRPWEWIAWFLVVHVLYSAQPFFRTNAFCWAVDDDCHHSDGRRREAVHAGIAKLFEEEGRAVTIVLVLGLGWLGLQTTNCELRCKTELDRGACVTGCELDDIANQPPLVLEYITFVLTYVVPAFGLLSAFHIWCFPIHGERLQALQRTQAVNFKDTRAISKNSDPVEAGPDAGSDLVEEGPPTPDYQGT